MTFADRDLATARWTAVLDEYEAVLAAQAALVERSGALGDDLAVAARLRFAPAAALPPIPPVLASRLRELGERTSRLADQAHAALAEGRGRQAGPARVASRRRAPTAAACTIDRLA